MKKPIMPTPASGTASTGSFIVSGRYVYTQVNSDTNDRDYVDHRFFITLGASRELYRW